MNLRKRIDQCMFRMLHDGSATSYATYLSVDGSHFVHLCRADTAFCLCGRPAQLHTHGVSGIECPNCRSAYAGIMVGALVLENEARERAMEGDEDGTPAA